MNINGIMVAGDLAGSSDSNLVISINGTSPINITPNALQWAASTTIPILGQMASATAAGQALTIQAQNSTGSSTNGGNLVLASGASASGTAGSVQLQSGIVTNLSLTSTGSLQFGSTITSPIVTQPTASTTGGNLSITAQSAGGTTNNGGSLVLTSGSSSTTGTSGNVIINTATPGGGGTAGNILFQVSGTTQAFVTTNASGAGFGIGSTPGTSPTITSGSGAPSSTEPNGSIYLNTIGSTGSTIYTRQNGSWFTISQATGSQILPLTETVTTNSSHSIYTVDSTGGGSDGIILHNYTASTTGYTYIMPAPTAGRQIIIRDITGGIETANNGGYITGIGTSSKVIFIAPHAVESFNGSSGYSMTGTSTSTTAFTTLNGNSTKFTTELAPGMSIVFNSQPTASYTVTAISSDTTCTITPAYSGTTASGATIKMNSLAYYANGGTLTLISNGTNWFASSNKPLRAYFTVSGTFIPSPGCTSATLLGCGGGGGGAGGSTNGAGGGGGGAIQSLVTISVTPNVASGYSVTIGSGGGGGLANGSGGIGGSTVFSSLAYFYGASPGGYSGATATSVGSGGYPFTNGNTNNNVIYSSTANGVGSPNANTSSPTIFPNILPGMMAMGGGGGQTVGNAVAGFINIMSNGSYAGGTASTTGGGGGGSGPQGSGGNGATGTSSGTAATANTGAGGGGGSGNAGTGGAGGSGYLYILLPM